MIDFEEWADFYGNETADAIVAWFNATPEWIDIEELFGLREGTYELDDAIRDLMMDAYDDFCANYDDYVHDRDVEYDMMKDD